jgi:hypothetical protein
LAGGVDTSRDRSVLTLQDYCTPVTTDSPTHHHPVALARLKHLEAQLDAKTSATLSSEIGKVHGAMAASGRSWVLPFGVLLALLAAMFACATAYAGASGCELDVVKKDEGLDDCIVKALQLMQEEQQVVCLVQSPTTRMRELADIFHSEFPNMQCTMTCATASPAMPAQALPP